MFTTNFSFLSYDYYFFPPFQLKLVPSLSTFLRVILSLFVFVILAHKLDVSGRKRAFTADWKEELLLSKVFCNEPFHTYSEIQQEVWANAKSTFTQLFPASHASWKKKTKKNIHVGHAIVSLFTYVWKWKLDWSQIPAVGWTLWNCYRTSIRHSGFQILWEENYALMVAIVNPNIRRAHIIISHGWNVARTLLFRQISSSHFAAAKLTLPTGICWKVSKKTPKNSAINTIIKSEKVYWLSDYTEPTVNVQINLTFSSSLTAYPFWITNSSVEKSFRCQNNIWHWRSQLSTSML